jgi:hypothetical protein
MFTELASRPVSPRACTSEMDDSVDTGCAWGPVQRVRRGGMDVGEVGDCDNMREIMALSQLTCRCITRFGA